MTRIEKYKDLRAELEKENARYEEELKSENQNTLKGAIAIDDYYKTVKKAKERMARMNRFKNLDGDDYIYLLEKEIDSYRNMLEYYKHLERK